MSSFKQSIAQYRLRITSAFLPVELTCARIRIAPASARRRPAGVRPPGIVDSAGAGGCERRRREPLDRGRELDAVLRTGIGL
jgi:hypothetical protein